jgi:hypothetical protein
MLYDIRPRPKELLVGEIQAAIERERFDRITINRVAGRTRRESDLHTFPASEIESYDSAQHWLDEVLRGPPFATGGSFKLRSYHLDEGGGAAKKTLERSFTMAKVGLAQSTRSTGNAAATEAMSEHLTAIASTSMNQATGLVASLGESHRAGRDYAISLVDRHALVTDELNARIMDQQSEITELRIRLEVKEILDARPSLLDPEILPQLLVAAKEIALVVGQAMRPLPSE